MNNGAD
jgi:hypothetical protein